MTDMEDSAEELIRTIAKFAGHIFGGTALFFLVAGAALLLHYFVQWVATQGMPVLIVETLGGLEYLLFAADVIVFGCWIVVSMLVTLRHIWDISRYR
jgi:hypothetical protein